MVKAAEKFYTNLYSDPNAQEDRGGEKRCNGPGNPSVTKNEVKFVLREMSRGKARGEDGLTMDQIKDAGDFVIKKLAQVYTECQQH